MPRRRKPDSGNYCVGYGRPPVQSRFQKGQSGNPKGRPKGALNLATVLLRTLRERVVIGTNGRREEITKLEVAVRQLVDMATSGDLRALSQLIELTPAAEQSVAEEMTPAKSVNEHDQKVILGLLKRYEKSIRGGGNHGAPAE